MNKRNKEIADESSKEREKTPVDSRDEAEEAEQEITGEVQETIATKVPAAEEGEGVEEVIAINRITKVTKGGKKLSFSALVVVGDANGHVGYSLAKAAEVSTAIRKAMAMAKRRMLEVPLKGTTIPHEIIGRCGGARVLLKPASEGTGVIAAGPVRAVCDGVGIRNILTKCHRSNNPINVVKATMDGLSRLKPGKQIPNNTLG